MALTIAQISGSAPVQAEGMIDGQCFYFRARSGKWQFGVGDTDDDAVDATYLPDLKPGMFVLKGMYGAFESYWLEDEAVREIIEQCATEYRAHMQARPDA